MQAAYPTAQDALNRLATLGDLEFTPAHAAAAAQQIQGAIAEFERRTGRIPLLVSGADVTRRLHAPVNREGVLLLDRDLASLTSVVYTPQDGSPTTLVLGTDYQVEPVNAPADGRPYEELHLAARQWYGPLAYPFRASLYVTGKWGYATAGIPDDAWEAMVLGACLRLWPALRVAGQGAANSWQRSEARGEAAGGGSLTEQRNYGTPGTDQLAEWRRQWTETVADFRRVSL